MPSQLQERFFGNHRVMPAEKAAEPGDLYRMISELFAHLGNRWALVVIFRLSTDPIRFLELKRKVDEQGRISARSLARTLHNLEASGLITRRQHLVIPPRVDYSLTARGLLIREMITQIGPATIEGWSTGLGDTGLFRPQA